MAVRIVVSNDIYQREKYLADFLESQGIKNPHPDLLYFDDETKLGVEEAKLIREHLSLKPFSFDKRIVLALSAQKLTPEAQNSLLKTLEEPPIASDIILAVSSLDNLLETVISRCEIVYLEKSSEFRVQNSEIEITEFINKNITERFRQIEKIEDKELFLGNLIQYYRGLLQIGEKDAVKILEELLNMQQWIKNNVNDRAILEYAALVIPLTRVDR
jgi:DNA polymerase III gamma/tau subunit